MAESTTLYDITITHPNGTTTLLPRCRISEEPTGAGTWLKATSYHVDGTTTAHSFLWVAGMGYSVKAVPGT